MDITKNPLPSEQGLAFQTHALQMILFGPFTCEPNTVAVRYESCPYNNNNNNKKRLYVMALMGKKIWEFNKKTMTQVHTPINLLTTNRKRQ